MAEIEIEDPHVSPILQGVEARMREGSLSFSVFVAADALVPLGADLADQETWLKAFRRHARQIADAAARMRRRARVERIFLETLAD